MPIYPVDPSIQATVSGQFAEPRKGESFGNILDTILATKAQGQAQALQVFEAITRGNPALAALIASQPGFVEAATATPSLRRGAPNLPGQIGAGISSGVQEFNRRPVPGAEIPAGERAKALAFFDKSEQTPENVAAYLAFLSPDAPPELASKAYAHLTAKAPKSLEAAFLTESMKGKKELAAELVRLGLFPDEASALKKVVTAKDEEYRQLQMMSMRLNMTIATQTLMKAQEEWSQRGTIEEGRILQLEEDQRRAQKELADLEEMGALFGTMLKGAVPDAETQEADSARKALASDLKRRIADTAETIRLAREAQRAKRAGAKPGAEGAKSETPEQRKARLKSLLKSKQ